MKRACLSVIVSTLAIFCPAQVIFASTIVPSNFNGYGTTVNGFQDFFQGTSFDPSWTEISNGASVSTGASGNFTLPGDGNLHINSGPGDPNKLLYNGPSYDASNQNVLAMIEVTSSGNGGDAFRGGVGAQSSLANGQGINELFRVDPNNGTGNHLNLLNDALAWGPAIGSSAAPAWTANTFYWIRETTSGSAITASIWAADGTTPESSAMSTTWSQSGRSGLAGLVADSSGGTGTFQVNYVLIQASGLPPIVAAVPEPASLVLCSLGTLAIFFAASRRHGARR